MESLTASLADHPQVLNGTFTAEELAERMITYVSFWDVVQQRGG